MSSRTIFLSCRGFLFCAGALFLTGVLLVSFGLHAQASQPAKASVQASNPRPQGPNPGKTSGQAADFTGVWYPSTGSTLGAATPDNPGQQFVWLGPDGKPRKGPLPLTAWGQEKLKSNRPTGPETTAIDSNDPDFQCFPSGVPRIYLFLYPMEIIHTPGRVLMLFEYGHTIRQIFTDGRGHLQDAEPTWMGDSIGHWEGDTLVVDTTGFNDKTWLGYGGQPHSEALHVIERIHRLDHDSLMIDITLDDPKAYTMPLHAQKKYILKPDWNLMEFVCEDNSLNFIEYEKKTRIQK
jgi:hypothetical protein